MKNNKVVHFLSDMITSSGSIWIKWDDKAKKLCQKRNISFGNFSYTLKEGAIIGSEVDGIFYFTLPQYDLWEKSVSYNSIRILNSYIAPAITDEQIFTYISQAEKKFGKTLHEQQRAAVLCGVRNGICVITGGPGTGKTCVLQVLTYVLRKLRYDIDIRFTAPTGKAARRITESTGNMAKTTQKELGITYTNRHKRFFGGDVLIIDEVSMLDLETAYHVFRAIKNGDKIILVGDIDQLPSVGPGAVLRDLIFSEVIPTVMLTKTFRQANDSNLFGNILKLKEGEWQMNVGDDFEVISTDRNCLGTLIDLFLKEYKMYGVENVACLLPYRKAGIICSDYVNNVIQGKVNPIGKKPFLSSKTETGLTVRFSLGDPVMQLKNRTECVNGDVGIVTRVSNNKMWVRFCDCEVIYTSANLSELSLAYAMSINKSQGSEYKSVVMCITTEHNQMLKRNLVYTGITRAKERVTLLQEDAAMMIAVADEDAYNRNTLLAERIRMDYLKIA